MEVEYPLMAGSTIKLSVKFGGKSIPLSVSPDFTVNDRKSLLQHIINLLPRGQKLIFKEEKTNARFLVETSTLKESGLGDGAKIISVACQGLHQGSVFLFNGVLEEASTRPISRIVVSDRIDQSKPGLLVDRDHTDRWKGRAVDALAQADLKNRKIPEEVWNYGSLARVLDISENLIIKHLLS